MSSMVKVELDNNFGVSYGKQAPRSNEDPYVIVYHGGDGVPMTARQFKWLVKVAGLVILDAAEDELRFTS